MNTNLNPDVSVKDVVLGGKSTFTLHSLKTDKHFTFKVTANDKGSIWFVKVLYDNSESYRYIGIIDAGLHFSLTKKSEADEESPSVIAMKFFLSLIRNDKNCDNLEFLHSGRCARCGRTITQPLSIKTGFGPYCRSVVERG